MTNNGRRRSGTDPRGVFPVSLGCPKNLVDTEIMAGLLVTSGYRLTLDEESASVYLINTCAFLPAAREEAYAAIRDAVRWKKRRPGRRIVVTGCLPEKFRDGTLNGRFPQVDVWLRVDAIPQLAAVLDGAPAPECGGEPVFLGDHTMPRLLLTMPHVAYLKIADGCDNRCAYCAIPGIRGGLRSRSAESVLTEARQLLAGGARELVVVAQDITAYGQDRPAAGETAGGLIRALDALDGDFRLRLLYTHPAHYTADFIDAVAESRHVVPYLDLPLQHINDRILRAMGRRVGRADVETLLLTLRERIPGLVLRTTFIAGLPGETEAEFAELEAFMRDQRFERCGVFAFSPEPGTPAARMPDQVSGEVAADRAAALMALQQEIMRERQREWVGRVDRVLIDAVSGNRAFGRGTADAPDIDNRVVISRGGRLKVGNFYDIVITAADAYELRGECWKGTDGSAAVRR